MPSLIDSPVTLVLALFNLAVSVPAFFNTGLLRSMALEPYAMAREHSYHQLVTAAFIHANWLHLGLNMFTLMMFGPLMEEMVLDATGSRVGYVLIYLVSMIAGNLYPFLRYRNTPNYIALGASGAVSGVVLAYCIANPMAMLRVFLMPMPAWLFAVLFIVISWFAMRSSNRGGIAHEAHLAGALGGVVATIIFTPQLVSFL